MRFVALIISSLLLTTPAWAFTSEQNSDGTTRTLTDLISQYVDVPEGAIDWKVFGQTKEIEIKTTRNVDGDIQDLEYVKPDFPDAVRKLDGQQITVKGFMFPLEESDDQKTFLFGPFPMSCPFHYHVGPSMVIEVHADQHPVKFSYDPVTITGQLELVPSDWENSIFYRLKDAHQVN
jgi:hypothetical protein